MLLENLLVLRDRLLIRHELIVVELPVAEPENDRLDEQGNRRSRPDPDQIRVADDGRQDQTERVRQRRREEEERHDEGLHAWRGARIRQLVGGDVAETLGDGAESDVGNLQPDAQGGDALAGGGVVGGVVAAGGGRVDLPLDDGANDARDPGEGEADGHAGDAAEFDVVFGEHGVEDVGEEGDEDDDCEGVEVALGYGGLVLDVVVSLTVGTQTY